MTFQAVLFDLDGTLLDTIEDLTDSMNAALAAMGLPARTCTQCKYFVGDGVRNFAIRAAGVGHCDEAAVGKLIEIYTQAYSKNWASKTRPYDGIAELLDALTARGLKMVVYSNKPDDFTQLCVRKLLPRWNFAAVTGAREGVPNKPDPTAALEIARRLAVAPAEFIYLGDTNTDMKCANSAGMFAAGALWGFRTADELLANGAKVLVKHPAEILGLLENE